MPRKNAKYKCTNPSGESWNFRENTTDYSKQALAAGAYQAYFRTNLVHVALKTISLRQYSYSYFSIEGPCQGLA